MRVLVVEDSRSLADVLAEGLRDQGMAVDLAFDGLEAAAKLDISAYDVVVLDRDLPGLHGDTLCQMITSRNYRVMVLMLTAAGLPGDRVSGLGLGADDYLTKPFHCRPVHQHRHGHHRAAAAQAWRAASDLDHARGGIPDRRPLSAHRSRPSSRAISRRWTSEVPSPISRIFASR